MFIGCILTAALVGLLAGIAIGLTISGIAKCDRAVARAKAGSSNIHCVTINVRNAESLAEFLKRHTRDGGSLR